MGHPCDPLICGMTHMRSIITSISFAFSSHLPTFPDLPQKVMVGKWEASEGTFPIPGGYVIPRGGRSLGRNINLKLRNLIWSGGRSLLSAGLPRSRPGFTHPRASVAPLLHLRPPPRPTVHSGSRSPYSSCGSSTQAPGRTYLSGPPGLAILILGLGPR